MKWEILKKFSVKKKDCFGYSDVRAEFPDKDPSHLSKVLTTMVSKGMLMKLSRDLYCIIPLGAAPETYFPDRRLVAKYIMKGKGYYLAYSSALYIHGLTDQPGARTIVATQAQRQSSKRNIKGREFQFIYHAKRRYFGYEEIWIAGKEPAMVSNLEKTIVDAVSRPQFCGGIAEVGKAIYRSNGRTDLDKLFHYLAKNGSHAAKKRYLYLSHILDLKWAPAHEKMLNASGASISLLDPSRPDQGMRNSRFGLKINLETNNLKVDDMKKL